MTAFTVHPVRCDRCAGTGQLGDRDPQSPRVRRCPACAEGVSGWEVRGVRLAAPAPHEEAALIRWLTDSGPTPHLRVPVESALIGTLPAAGTIDRAAAETFASCLECVPGREVEATEYFAETECYAEFMIEAMGGALAGEPAPAIGGGGR